MYVEEMKRKTALLIVFLVLATNIILSSTFNGLILDNIKIDYTIGNLCIGNAIRVTTDISDDVDPSLIQTDTGYMIAFQSREDIWVTNSTDGVQWSSPVQVTTNTSSDKEPSLIQTRSGYMIAFKSSRAGNYDIWVTNSCDGVQWSSPVQVTRGVDEERSPSLIQTRSGFMVSFSNRSGSGDVYVISSGDGVSWGNLTRVTIDVGGFYLDGFYGTSLIQTNVGYMIAFTSTRRDSVDYGIWVANSSDGLVWSNATPVDIRLDWPVGPIPGDTAWQIFPSLIQTCEGGYMLAFYSTQFFNIGVTNSSDGMTWSNAIQVANPFDQYPSLIQTDAGYMIAFESGRTENNVDIWIITLAEDFVKPLVSVTISPSNPTTSSNVTFTVNATDAESGIANVTLYVDGNMVKTWTTEGSHTYTGGPYPKGNHTYRAIAYDIVGNMAEADGTFIITVEAVSVELSWWIAGVIAVAVVVGAVAIYFVKVRKT